MKTRQLIVLLACMALSVSASAFQKAPENYLTTPNQFLDVGGVKYAYRLLGKQSTYPLVLFQHFRGSMDNWDPALIDALAAQRTVIVFDNKGVGLSEGEAPDSFEAMGDDAANFITALGYKKVDVLGFSVGGAVAQTLTLQHPGLVHKLILAGTAPKGAESINHRDPKIITLVTHATSEEETFLATFYAPTPFSQQEGRASLARRAARSAVFDKATGTQVLQAHTRARQAWGMPADSSFAYLQKIAQPVLVATGSDDIMMFTSNSYTLYTHLPDAKLILYPNSAHGFLFQYPIQFAKDAGDFLDNLQTKQMKTIETTTQIRHVSVRVNSNYEQFTKAFESLAGKIDLSKFGTGELQRTPDAFVNYVHASEGYQGLMIFGTTDYGAGFQLIGQRRFAKQYLIGNPLIAFSMTKHDIRASLYAPLKVLIYVNDTQETMVEYDLPSDQFGQFGDQEIVTVALGLNEKLSKLIEKADERKDL